MAGRKEKQLLDAKELAALISDIARGTDLPPLLTADHIAAILKVPKSTVYSWSSQGLLDGCKVQAGKHRRFVRDKFFQILINEGLHGN